MDLRGRTTLFGQDDVIEGSRKMDYENQVLVLKPEVLAEAYRTPENQLFVGCNGFGLHPYTTGRAVTGYFLSDGEQTRYERELFIGILKPELFEEYVITLKQDG